MTAPIRTMPELPVVRTMQDVVDVFRVMKEHWGLTNGFCDDVGGLTPGHTDKVLGPSEEKRIGYDTFALFMELCVVEFVPRINPEALLRMEAVWEKRERPLYPNAKVKRISKKLVERAKPYVYRDSGRSGGLKRGACLAAKQAALISRKGGKSRARALSKQRRSEIARTGGLAKAKRRRDAIAAQELSATLLPEQRPDLPALECPSPNASQAGAILPPGVQPQTGLPVQTIKA